MSALTRSWSKAASCLALVVSIAGCGGGGGGGGGSPSSNAPPVANTAAVTVDGGPAGLVVSVINGLFTSVTVCVHGTSDCQTVDHILVDTGSSGLRILSSALALSSSLSPETDTAGNPLAECVQFADGTFVWGPIRTADIKMAGEQASSAPIQIIGDPQFTSIPAACTGIPNNTVETFGAKGILGVGNFREDCGPFCAQVSANGLYFSCPASSCTGVAVGTAKQVVQPVALFSSDNNGVAIQLPSVGSAGAASVAGSLIFGIGTQADNALGNAKVFRVDPNFATLSTGFNGQVYPASFFDSGSSALFLPAAFGVPACSGSDPIAAGFLCPPATQHFSTTIVGADGSSGAASFDIANADTLLASGQLTAFSNLGAPGASDGVDWGLPAFYGRTVFTAIENASTPGGTGPYVAF